MCWGSHHLWTYATEEKLLLPVKSYMGAAHTHCRYFFIHLSYFRPFNMSKILGKVLKYIKQDNMIMWLNSVIYCNLLQNLFHHKGRLLFTCRKSLPASFILFFICLLINVPFSPLGNIVCSQSEHSGSPLKTTNKPFYISPTTCNNKAQLQSSLHSSVIINLSSCWFCSLPPLDWEICVCGWGAADWGSMGSLKMLVMMWQRLPLLS